MARMPGIPYDPGECPQGTLNPLGVVAHRTYGSWNGDYGVGKGNKPPVGFHFLVGKEQGQWVQFYDTGIRCAHAGTNANGNDISIGIEIEGTNSEPMTPWQLDATAQIMEWIEAAHGIERVYRFSTGHDLKADYGYIPHSAVKGADHSDYWTIEDWERLVSSGSDVIGDRDMLIVQRSNGEQHLVGLSGPVGIASPEDRAELVQALKDPNYSAKISEKMWEALRVYHPSNH